MNNTWKLSVLGGVALIASACVAAAGCTVTSTSGDLDSGIVDSDSGTARDTGSGTDTGTAVDSGGGTDSGTTCAATVACPIIGSSQGVTFDSCKTCDNCMATNCCSQTTACFTKEADGGQSDCEQLFDCVATCDAADAGQSCVDACAQAHPSGTQTALALQGCQQSNCGATDAGTAACQ